MMRIFYHDIFPIPLPAGHRFPIGKYPLLRQRVAEAQLGQLVVGEWITDEALLRGHSAEYIHKTTHGLLTPQEIRRTGFPWSPAQAIRARHSAGSTLGASFAALEDGIGVNLGGGTHHAHWDWGQGYCVFNDLVVAARALQARRLVERVLIIDCDVHQGNGTATLTQDDPTIFTFSMHGEKNFPFKKATSDLDIGLPDHTTDEEYLALLEESLWRIFALSHADFVLYIAGADPFHGDKLGKLDLTKAGLMARDKHVFEACREANVPLAITMGGGYAKQMSDSVDIQFNTVKLAAAYATRI